jgi:hypothetical protein
VSLMSNSAGPKITKDGLVLDFDAANPKSYNFYADPYASNVSLHLKMDGANGSTTFTDSSPNALTVTAVGNAQISTAQSRYNGSAGYFDGGTNSYVSIADYFGFQFGTGDFTIEFWFYSTSTSTGNRGIISYANSYSIPTTNQWWIGYLGTSGTASFEVNFGSGFSTTSFTRGDWHHVAISRSSSTVRFFIDGILSNSQTDNTNYTSNNLFIGKYGWITQCTNFYIDNLRITKGVARYTSAFTSPPIPSTCTDLTRSKNVGTLTGGVDYNFSNGGSLVFDGSNDYVNIPANTNLTFGTGDFTMEVWCKTRAKTNLYPALLSVNLAWAANVWVLIDRHNSTAPTKFTFHANNIASPLLTSATATSNGVWYNVVVTRIGTLFSMYVNGVLESTATSSASLDGGVSNSINLGRQSAGDSTNYDGNISHARIYKARGLTSAEVYNNFVANRGRFGV